MGSGRSGLYSGTNGGSQPYAASYCVETKMHQYDINNGTYHDGHYDVNPTSVRLTDKIRGNYIGDKNTNFKMPYVIDMNDNIIIGKRNGNGRDKNSLPTPHPTLIGGKNPQVQMAGILEIRGGKIYKYDNNSGHYKPSMESMPVADRIFGKLDSILFYKKNKRSK